MSSVINYRRGGTPLRGGGSVEARRAGVWGPPFSSYLGALGRGQKGDSCRRSELTFPAVKENVTVASPSTSPETPAQRMPKPSRTAGFTGCQNISLRPSRRKPLPPPPPVACFLGKAGTEEGSGKGTSGGVPLVLFSPRYLGQRSRSCTDFHHYCTPQTHILRPPPSTPREPARL